MSAVSVVTLAELVNAVPCGAAWHSTPVQPRTPTSCDGRSVAHPVSSALVPGGAPITRWIRSSWSSHTAVTLSIFRPGTIGWYASNTGRCQDAAQLSRAPSGWMRRRTLRFPLITRLMWLSAGFFADVGPVVVE